MKQRKIVPNAVKEKIRAFVKSERGQVSRTSVLTLSAFLGSAAIAGIIAAKTIQASSVSVNLITNPGQGGTVVRIRGTYA